MTSYQKSNEEIKQVERTIEEEIELSELAQIVPVFDDVEEAKRNYKEAKKELIRRVNSLKKIESRVKSSIIYKDNLLNADILIEKLDNLELQIKSSALAVEEIDRYEFDKKKKRKVFRTEYFIKERSNSSGNSEEERLIKFLNQKQEMVKELEIFIECFNGLNETKRKLIYYSLFKNETNIQVSERLNYAERTLHRLKVETILQLIDTLILIE